MNRYQKAIVALLLLGCIMPSTARASNLKNSISLTPSAAIYLFNGKLPTRVDGLYGLALGYNMSENWGIELSGVYKEGVNSTAYHTQKERGNLYQIRLDGLYHIFPDNFIVPYLAAGAGVMVFNATANSDLVSDEDLVADVGGGLKVFLNDYIALRGDARYIVDFTTNDLNKSRDFYNNFAFTAGVTFQFGGVKAKKPEQSDK